MKKTTTIEEEFTVSFYDIGDGKHLTSGKIDNLKRGHYAFEESFMGLAEMIEQLSVPLGTKVIVTLEVEK